MNPLKIEVDCADRFMTKGVMTKNDKGDKKAFEKSIANYLLRFNALPPIGLYVSNGRCDDGKIEWMSFDGCSGTLLVFLKF